MSILPNILVIFTDQHRAQAMSCAGDPNITTPNLDRLAAEGMRFNRAYSNCPLCSPARATFYTGKYPSSHGAFALHVPPEPGQVMLPQVLKEAGYFTSHYGKWHISGGAAPSHFVSPYFRPGWDEWKGWENSNEPWATKYSEGDFPLPVLTLDKYQTDALADMTIDFIRERGSSDCPWFHVVSIEPPHDPNTPPEAYRTMFEDHDFSFRENVPEDYYDDPRWRNKLVGYYGQLKNLDDNIGRIMAALESSGQSKNTMILYFSDHGDMLGSHGVQGKSVSNVESSRIPLIVSYPGFVPGGQVSEHTISMVDLMPTILGMVGMETPPSVEGTDMTEVLKGHEAWADEGALIQFERNFYGLSNSGQIYRCLAREQWLYTKYLLTGEETLYDLENDPYQLEDLAADVSREEVLVRMREALSHKVTAIGDDFFDRDRTALEKW